MKLERDLRAHRDDFRHVEAVNPPQRSAQVVEKDGLRGNHVEATHREARPYDYGPATMPPPVYPQAAPGREEGETRG